MLGGGEASFMWKGQFSRLLFEDQPWHAGSDTEHHLQGRYSGGPGGAFPEERKPARKPSFDRQVSPKMKVESEWKQTEWLY